MHHRTFDINSELRGLAILAVLAIHILANIPYAFQINSPFWPYSLLIDQLSRFCVPLFIMLSGYGFWEKYQKHEFHLWNFWRRQAEKLLPLYAVVSIISYLIFFLIPNWRNPLAPHSLVTQLITGQADYHLYFVPVIFQCYLLFPILRKVVQRFPWSSLLLAGIFQVWLYRLYGIGQPVLFGQLYLNTDQQQYVWFFSWIFYFVLGMHISRISAWFSQYQWRVIGLGFTALIAWLVIVLHGRAIILQGIDPVTALRTTQIGIMIYATTVSVWLFTVFSKNNWLIKKIAEPLRWLGQRSYAIYLCHVMILRILFSL